MSRPQGPSRRCDRARRTRHRQHRVRAALSMLRRRIRGGDIGSLPVIVGLAIIWAVFQLPQPALPVQRQPGQPATECAAVGTIAIGVVLLLLVAQIDLSVGSMSGLAAAILGVGLTQHGLVRVAGPMRSALLAGVLVGPGLRLHLRPVRRAQLRDHAGRAAGPARPAAPDAGHATGRSTSPSSRGSSGSCSRCSCRRSLSYVFAVAASRRLCRLRGWRAPGAAPAPVCPPVSCRHPRQSRLCWSSSRSRCWYLNRTRGSARRSCCSSALVVFRLRADAHPLGPRRSIAVGGSVEAARRAGINVNRIYISVFMLGSTLAALGGLLAAGRLAAASISSGTGDVNLNAIAAAVIGGTEPFRWPWQRLLGPARNPVIPRSPSGLTLLSLDSSSVHDHRGRADDRGDRRLRALQDRASTDAPDARRTQLGEALTTRRSPRQTRTAIAPPVRPRDRVARRRRPGPSTAYARAPASGRRGPPGGRRRWTHAVAPRARLRRTASGHGLTGSSARPC